MNIGTRLLVLTFGATLGLVGMGSKAAHAAVQPIELSKTMHNITLTSPSGSLLSTLSAPGDTVKVDLIINNEGDQINGITVRDSLGEAGRSFAKPASITMYNGGVEQDPSKVGYGSCKGSQQGNLTDTSAADPLNISFDTTSAVPNLKQGTQYCVEYTLTATAPMFPSFKSRLVGFPVYVTDSGSSTEALYDVSYLYINPIQGQHLSANLYSSSNNALDLGVIIPGATVKVTSGGSSIKDTTTPATVLLQPNQNTLTQSAPTDTQCQITPTFGAVPQRSRGSACLFSAAVKVTNSSGVDEGGSTAYFLALPSSTIIGNVYGGANSLDASKLLLPGQHVATGTKNGLSQNNVSYSIDPNSVSGWSVGTSPAQIYKNVYQNANVARLLRNPDRIVDNTTCGQYALSFTCVRNAQNEWDITMNLNASTDLNLGASSLKGTVTNNRNDGFVVLVKGNLIIDNSTASPTTLTNWTRGTLIVQGRLTIHNVNITPGGTSNAGLGFIVLGADSATSGKAARWNVTDNANDYSLKSVGFFVPGTPAGGAGDGTFQVLKPGPRSLTLTGSIVANNVDLSAVAAPPDPDNSGITIQYDQTLATYPPPGFTLFSSTPVLRDTAP